MPIEVNIGERERILERQLALSVTKKKKKENSLVLNFTRLRPEFNEKLLSDG